MHRTRSSCPVYRCKRTSKPASSVMNIVAFSRRLNSPSAWVTGAGIVTRLKRSLMIHRGRCWAIGRQLEPGDISAQMRPPVGQVLFENLA